VIVAHVGGVPVEEIVPTLAGAGAGTGLLLARAWLTVRLRRRREPGKEGDVRTATPTRQNA
jgi:hypothetical protein